MCIAMIANVVTGKCITDLFMQRLLTSRGINEGWSNQLQGNVNFLVIQFYLYSFNKLFTKGAQNTKREKWS